MAHVGYAWLWQPRATIFYIFEIFNNLISVIAATSWLVCSIDYVYNETKPFKKSIQQQC